MTVAEVATGIQTKDFHIPIGMHHYLYEKEKGLLSTDDVHNQL